MDFNKKERQSLGRFTKKQISLWYDQYGEAVFKFIFMMIKDYQQAEDLTEETFVKAYVHIDAFQETADILNRSESKVKSTLFRALHGLERQLLKGDYEYDSKPRQTQ
ncbi:sigma factor [Priestia sp. FSL W8-0001]|uniref:sigma factor n=1 Tax=Priestia sp. FSL W8-0001 TaxID=2921708 RepID=UPI0030FD5E04